MAAEVVRPRHDTGEEHGRHGGGTRRRGGELRRAPSGRRRGACAARPAARQCSHQDDPTPDGSCHGQCGDARAGNPAAGPRSTDQPVVGELAEDGRREPRRPHPHRTSADPERRCCSGPWPEPIRPATRARSASPAGQAHPIADRHLLCSTVGVLQQRHHLVAVAGPPLRRIPADHPRSVRCSQVPYNHGRAERDAEPYRPRRPACASRAPRPRSAARPAPVMR